MPRLAEFLSKLSRNQKIAFEMVCDALLIVASFVAALLIRLDSARFLSFNSDWAALLVAVATTLFLFWALGLYRALIRFVTGEILPTVAIGAMISAITLYAASLVLSAPLPRTAPIIYATFVFLSVGGLRFFARSLFRRADHTNKRPVIIYGSGVAGLQLLNSLFHGRDYAPIALVDDDPDVQNLVVSGLKVFAPSALPRLVDQTGARVILLAIPNISRARRREIVAELGELQVEIKTIPTMSEIISGKAKVSELRTVSAVDLLGRDPVAPDPDLLQHNITGKVVMVSGAGGSIGSELCRQILQQRPTALILYEMSEFALYAIESELTAIAARLAPATRIVPLLGSVQHRRRLETAIKAFGVQTIYHAAAYKHVPLVEQNVVEGVRNNVFGTLAIVRAASKLGVESFILISTDKAVRPTNVMGATKRVAELICQAYAREPGRTIFSMVRFGNVLGSSGSVIPRFKAQIESGGPVTVTHRDINRYFMTIPEASQLVIQAGAMAKGGDVFVLDMGEPVKIMDLAISMVRLHGLTPYLVDHPDQVAPEKGDIPVCVTGLREGEKLYEELLIGGTPSATQHPRIMTASEVSLSTAELTSVLERLTSACDEADVEAIVGILMELPLEYTPFRTTVADLMAG